MIDIDTQHEYLLKYKIDPIEVGKLSEKYPGLKQAWEEFIELYNESKMYEATNN